MRRDVVNRLVRVRRDLRFLLADRYQALLGSRFVLLTAMAAGVLDRGSAALAAVRRFRSGNPTQPAGLVTVVRAAVTNGDELSLVVRDAPAGTSAVALRRGPTVEPLPTIVERGEVLRLVATLPESVFDGADRTVALVAGDDTHDVAVVDDAALAVRLSATSRHRDEARSEDSPPRLRADGGRLSLRGKPAVAGIRHAVEVGVRSAIVTWAQATDDAQLVLVAGESRHTFAVRLHDGTARATIDLAGLGDTDATWFAYAGQVPLVLPRDAFPPLTAAGRTHRVPLPTRGATGRVVEVGYSPDNQLVVRVGNFSPAVS